MEIKRELRGDVLLIDLEGRLDAYWAGHTRQALEKEIKAGYHQIVLDLHSLTYLSSAGLRIFLQIKKQLESVGGDVVLVGLSDFVRNVFEVSGFNQLFQVLGSVSEAESHFVNAREVAGHVGKEELSEASSAVYQIRDLRQGPSLLTADGSIAKLPRAQYTEADLVEKTLADLKYGIGIGSLGDTYEEVKKTFGEMLILNNNVFYLPTDGNNIPDFLLADRLIAEVKINMLFSGSFEGKFNLIARFEARDKEKGVCLSELYRDLFDIAAKREGFKGLLATVACGETVGLFGASLKRSPIAENAPANGLDISVKENLKKWLHFSVELEHRNKTACMVGLGLARDQARNFSERFVQSLFSVSPTGPDILLHNHCVVFNFMPLTSGSFDLEGEIDRVAQHGECVSVQHLLEKSAFREGVVGVCLVTE